MPDMPSKTLHTIEETRARYFTPQWFGDLLSGRLGAGDTYWIGNIGIELFVAPALVLATLLTKIANPAAVAPLLAVAFALTGLYRLALLRGLWITTRRSKPVTAWHWTGLLTTLAFALTELGLAASMG